MAEVQLDSPSNSVTLVAGHTQREPKTLILICHDKSFENAVIKDGSDADLFTVKSKWNKSWSFRRHLHDAAGNHLLDLRHYSLDIKNRWTVEDPAGKQLAHIEHFKQVSARHSDVDMTIKGKNGTPDALVHMRQKDSGGITTFVAVEGATVAEIALTERNDLLGDLKTDKPWTAWKIRVAPTVDLALIAVLALCRAEMSHVWSR